MTWSLRLPVRSIAQTNETECAAVSAEIVLNALGLRTQHAAASGALQPSIDSWTGPMTGGNPVGVAATINRYAPPDWPGALADSDREFRVVQTAMPYDACGTMIDALVEYQSPAAALVYFGTHWVVVVGAAGEGIPRAGHDYRISGLWVCNPAVPMTIEYVTYGAWLYEYFNGGSMFGTDQFIAVADRRARPAGTLRLPPPDMLPVSGFVKQPILNYAALAVTGLKEAGLRDWITSEALASYAGAINPLYVGTPGPGRGTSPFVLAAFDAPLDDEGNANWTVVRMDEATGAYLGAATGIQPGPTLQPSFTDIAADTAFVERQSAAFQRDLEALTGARDVTATTMWFPGGPSASPYAPFVRFTDGTRSIYVTQDGRGVIAPARCGRRVRQRR